MNVDWHQETTLGPQSLLKTLAACQGSSNFAAQREPCWQLVRSQGVTWRPGGNDIFQNTQANSPMMGDLKAYRYVCSLLSSAWDAQPSLQSAGAPMPLTFMAELGTRSFVSLYSAAEGVPLKPSLVSIYGHPTLNTFMKSTLYVSPRGVVALSARFSLLFEQPPQGTGT